MKKTMEDIVYVKSMDADANGTVAAVTAVSYTHLDVYKRQV